MITSKYIVQEYHTMQKILVTVGCPLKQMSRWHGVIWVFAITLSMSSKPEIKDKSTIWKAGPKLRPTSVVKV